jgi:hypothetical protein
MRTMLGALAIAGGVALICCEGVQAMPAEGMAMKDAVPTASMLQLARLMSDRIHHARSDAETARQTARQHHHHSRKSGTSHR